MQKVMDASALLCYLNKEPGYEKVEGLLAAAAEKDKNIMMSAVNWGEALYVIRRELKDYHEAEAVESIIDTLPIEIVAVDREQAREAAAFKVEHKMSYADCFAAALARKKKAELITGDKEFKTIEKEIRINWIS